MKNRNKAGFYFVLPWVIGFCLFTIFPMIAAIYIGLTDWSIIANPNFIGFDNYTEIFSSGIFYKAVWVTIRFAVLAVPLSITVALVVAILLSNKLKGVSVFRVLYYMPAIVSGVAVAIVFKWILDPNYGLINSGLSIFGIEGPDWLFDTNWVLPSYLIMALWGASGGFLIYLAAIKDISKDLYESAEIDGASVFRKAWHITVPLLTPIIFYNLVMGIIGSLRKFTDAYILGGAGNEAKFYMVHLYEEAFMDYNMGYATALAWVLFGITMIITAIVLISKKYWVHKG